MVEGSGSATYARTKTLMLEDPASMHRLLDVNARAVVAKHVNAAGVKEREDVAKLNGNLQQELAAKGMVFNQPDPGPFRDKLRKAGFYSEWKGKYGDEAWALLERAVGTLA